ncbi:MAG: hypothetical protein GKR89_23550 [Candidatus Latescibacteria bacterium]|nr:hypothetical protein [Candidatus Latescibacterota bacterium]
MSRISFIFICTATLALTGCQHFPLRDVLGLGNGDGNDPGKPAQEERDRRALEQMREEIYALVGKAPCESEEDCRFIGLGAKPCGGPWEYLVFSTAYTNPDQLRPMVRRYNEFEGEMNQRYGYASDCALASPPEVGCIEGHCVALGQSRPLPPEPEPQPVDNPVQLQLIDSFAALSQEPGLHDPFELRGLSIDGYTLSVEVAYSGGCQYHDFQLWATPATTRSQPPGQPLQLTHNANGDACEAYLQETRRFDLAPLRQLHPDFEELILMVGDQRVLFRL